MNIKLREKMRKNGVFKILFFVTFVAPVFLCSQATAEPEGSVCKAATTLHTESCEGGSCGDVTSNDIVGATINAAGEITYGFLPNSRSPKPGDAYDCDVNGDGTYDADTERFYYLNSNGANARLVYYSGYNNGPDNTFVTDYDNALENLPSSAEWANTKLVASGSKVASLPTVQDLANACGINLGASPHRQSLKSCAYLFENTVFAKTKNLTADAPYNGAAWIGSYGGRYYRIISNSINIGDASKNHKNYIRPVIEVALTDIETVAQVLYTVSFDTHGAAAVSPVQIEKGDEIGVALPMDLERAGFVLNGWSTSADGPVDVDEHYVVLGGVTLHAIWEDVSNKVALSNGKYYDTLQQAIDAAAKNTKTKIALLKDTTEALTLDTTRNIELDLHGYTVDNSSAITIKNKGTLELSNGTISNSFGNAIVNDGGTMTILSGTVSTTANSGTINNNANSTLTISGGTIIGGGKQAVYNDGGTLYINGDPVIRSTSSGRATVHNLNDGVMEITGGTITSTGTYAVYNDKGTMTIGTKDGSVDLSTPVITGKTYGVIANYQYAFYDGIIKGRTYPTGKANSSTNPSVSKDELGNNKINDIEAGATKTEGADGDYKTLYLAQ